MIIELMEIFILPVFKPQTSIQDLYICTAFLYPSMIRLGYPRHNITFIKKHLRLCCEHIELYYNDNSL